ncbi:hypothetical protein KsCSTR_18940 [Candidatus Kuenenia stuttgartiensis]|uniref:Uncharacterized protein n=1 Tax=Kuenenia stuttgartiensis TaxID=174633 RepID=A0A6G7GPM3_KUEST|nr:MULTISPECIES: hypothetical protein [Kuenenia]MBE7548804.1 hypothetical protein [Planctomycetia bacterium]MBZ0191501.1 hypothetical protein [Candidatus Kuenenia stuttgartiensis]MCL4727179.1 hypothetical protein [Candidatus Kuenenia stuttgartiensis]MCZ7622309.1 hypothetical protein [Candidatus Kuenenia sp.]QII11273.1 hypothetical protein KsCSTR_18940 [Candidatus Kuenenia stuttgartiensis]
MKTIFIAKTAVISQGILEQLRHVMVLGKDGFCRFKREGRRGRYGT